MFNSVSLTKKSLILIGTLTTAHMINDFYAHVLPFVIPALIQDLKISYFEAGMLALAISIFSGVLSPFLGQMGDRHAWRKRIMIFGFLAFCLGLLIMGLSANYALILVACFIFGLGEFTFHPQSTNFLTRNFPGTKGKVMGIHGIGGSIGNFTAPLVVTFLITLVGWRESLFYLTIPGLLTIFALKMVLKEPPKAKKQALFGGITLPLLLLTVNFAMIQMVYKGFLIFLPTFLIESGSTMQSAGAISALMLFTGLFTQPLGGILMDKLGGRVVFIGSSITSAIALWLFTVSSGVFVVITILMFGAAIYALFPVALAMASQVVRSDHVGMSVGLVFGIGSTFSAFTPMLTGLAADRIGLQASFQYLIVFPVLALIVALFLPSKQKLASAIGNPEPAG
ncbi:MAG: MFS transporter [SAR324 cluster bacterium]|nr:MFS transporter [SAR324 cluster bacterium]